MAAHARTGIKQLLEQIERNGSLDMGTLRSATELSCFTEDDHRLWEHLRDFVEEKSNLFVLRNHLHEDLERVTIEWKRLDKPDTREEWMENKYGKEEGQNETV